MKKMNFKLLFVFISAFALILSSCKDDEGIDYGDPKIPAQGRDFTVIIDDNDVTFTTTLTGITWFTNAQTGTEHQVAGGEVQIFIPIAGSYPFVCSNINAGITYSSDTFFVAIETSNLTFLESGAWKHLTGGHTAGVSNVKKWRVDINSAGECVYFDGPLYYSGFEDAAKVRYPFWAWDVTDEVSAENPYVLALDGGGTFELTSYFNWEPAYNQGIMAAKDYGTISFDGITGTVTTTIFGVTETGTFSFDDETMKLSIKSVVLPIDTSRLNEGQFEEANLGKVRIFSISDSAMQIGIKRSFEGGKPSEWTNVYNFVVDGYVYPPKVLATQPVLTSFSAADIVGTWKYTAVPYDWIGWEDQNAMNNWADTSAIASWAPRGADVAAVYDDVFVFNNDGTCTLNGVANTYTVAAGVITFGTALTTEIAISWFAITGTNAYVLDVLDPAPATGQVWIGIPDGSGKLESLAVRWIKQ
ncbi:MAG: hypothetical protein R6W78_05130 [Bacteroidales bacterium]